ncbi:MAG TPA: 3-phosphoglycerate dehydrogenase [Candidatus Coprocola pullicola]|mgnify:FL=1|nr:3-phosphoglycerate dehydrogenase [Candidatus Coprocola pullicola]
MYNIRTLNQISHVGLKKLSQSEFTISDTEENPEGIIVRSFDMHDMPFPSNLLAIARAGAGTNNIPIDRCTQEGIPVFNTPGANANAVKELVLTGLLISSRKVLEGANWTQTLIGTENIEKAAEVGKKQFTGPEITGKKLGVIGLGAIGVLVANAALDLGMAVIGYDPYLSIDSAWHLSSSVKHASTLEEVVSQSDYITLHIPLNDKTKYFFNKDLFAATKRGARLLNFARGELVDNQALKCAIREGIISKYIVDFPSADLLGIDKVIVTPHLGASTPESEENCAMMASVEIREYLKYGNIKNSVNFPTCYIDYSGKPRVTISHKNMVNMIGQLGAVFTKYCINIDNMINKSKGDLAYNIIVCDSLNGKEKELMEDLSAIESVIKVRILY